MITTLILCGGVFAGSAYLSEKSINPDAKPISALKTGASRIYDTFIGEIQNIKSKKQKSEPESEVDGKEEQNTEQP